ncbi:MAG: sensor domain-containing diguanylate cyclase [Desulfobacterales bacterium]
MEKPSQKSIQNQMRAVVRRMASLEAAITELRGHVERYHLVFDDAPEGLALMDARQVINAISRSLVRMLGYPREDIVGKRTQAFLVKGSVEVFSASPNHLTFEARFATRSGGTLPILVNRSTFREDGGRIHGYVSFFTDLSDLKEAQEELRKSEERYRQLSLKDSLTGLYNTRHLYAALDTLTFESRTEGTPFSLVFMDMDNFKQTVDRYGHLNGSRALQEVAGTIRDCLQPPAFGVAYGGDEFVMVLPGLRKPQARKLAERVKARMKASTYLAAAGHHVKLSASFGVASCPEDGDNRTLLLALADQAMFRVKAGGKDGVAVSKGGPVTGLAEVE